MKVLSTWFGSLGHDQTKINRVFKGIWLLLHEYKWQIRVQSSEGNLNESFDLESGTRHRLGSKQDLMRLIVVCSQNWNLSPETALKSSNYHMHGRSSFYSLLIPAKQQIVSNGSPQRSSVVCWRRSAEVNMRWTYWFLGSDGYPFCDCTARADLRLEILPVGSQADAACDSNDQGLQGPGCYPFGDFIPTKVQFCCEWIGLIEIFA